MTNPYKNYTPPPMDRPWTNEEIIRDTFARAANKEISAEDQQKIKEARERIRQTLNKGEKYHYSNEDVILEAFTHVDLMEPFLNYTPPQPETPVDANQVAETPKEEGQKEAINPVAPNSMPETSVELSKTESQKESEKPPFSIQDIKHDFETGIDYIVEPKQERSKEAQEMGDWLVAQMESHEPMENHSAILLADNSRYSTTGSDLTPPVSVQTSSVQGKTLSGKPFIPSRLQKITPEEDKQLSLKWPDPPAEISRRGVESEMLPWVFKQHHSLAIHTAKEVVNSSISNDAAAWLLAKEFVESRGFRKSRSSGTGVGLIHVLNGATEEVAKLWKMDKNLLLSCRENPEISYRIAATYLWKICQKAVMADYPKLVELAYYKGPSITSRKIKEYIKAQINIQKRTDKNTEIMDEEYKEYLRKMTPREKEAFANRIIDSFTNPKTGKNDARDHIEKIAKYTKPFQYMLKNIDKKDPSAGYDWEQR